MVGAHTPKKVDVTIISKLFMDFLSMKKRGKLVEDNKCKIKYEGVRKAMEANTALISTRNMYDMGMINVYVVADDPSSMKANLWHSYTVFTDKG